MFFFFHLTKVRLLATAEMIIFYKNSTVFLAFTLSLLSLLIFAQLSQDEKDHAEFNLYIVRFEMQ